MPTRQSRNPNRVNLHIFRFLGGGGEGQLGVVAFVVVFLALVAAGLYLSGVFPHPCLILKPLICEVLARFIAQ
jgi:hypothetical protein